MWNKAITVLMPKKRKLSHLNGNHHFITTKNVVSPPSCINRLTSYIGLPCEQSLQHLICANMCFKKRYVTLVKLTFKCIQHLSIHGSDFQKKCFLLIPPSAKLILFFQKDTSSFQTFILCHLFN